MYFTKGPSVMTGACPPPVPARPFLRPALLPSPVNGSQRDRAVSSSSSCMGLPFADGLLTTLRVDLSGCRHVLKLLKKKPES